MFEVFKCRYLFLPLPSRYSFCPLAAFANSGSNTNVVAVSSLVEHASTGLQRYKRMDIG